MSKFNRRSTSTPGAGDQQPHPAEFRSRILQRDLGEQASAYRSPVHTPENERHAAAAHQQSLSQLGHTCCGKIVWSSPYIDWYRVLLDNGDSDIVCCRASDTSWTPFSVKRCGTLPAGTNVLCWHSQFMPYGVILCALPSIVADGGSQWPDWIAQGSNGGFRREAYFKEFAELFARDGGAVDFSNGSPVDGSALGEVSYLDPLGGGLHIDPWLKFFRVDETCGIWLFQADRLLRIAGNAMDVQSSAHEVCIRNDEGESLHYSGYAVYPWELLGAWRPGDTTYRSVPADGVHYSEPYGAMEPLHDDQKSFCRYEEYRGYLGQGFRRHVAVPPAGASGLNRYGSELVPYGVFSEQIGLDGHWAVASAHSISINKRIIIPIPSRQRLPEDPQGDDVETGEYNSSGLPGANSHVVSGNMIGSSELPHLFAAAAIQDSLAYTYQWKGLHTFDYHLKDFYTPQPSQAFAGAVLQQMPNYGQLGGSQWLEPPQPKPLNVDHRYGSVNYYETMAGLNVLPDGSVVIRDGYGSEIRMSGGSVQISAPGDIWGQSGKNINLWAGDDAVVKAQNSIDVTAANKDVRIKSERHFEVLSANSGIGRLLLDCRAAGANYNTNGVGEDVPASGMVLKCAKGDVVALGGNVKLRTGGGDLLPGMIVLDAAKGGQVIRLVADQVNCHTANGLNVAMAVGASKHTVHHLGPFAVHLPSPCCLKGGLTVVQNGIQFSGNLVGIHCTIVSDGNTSGLIAVHAPGDLSWDTVAENIRICRNAFGTLRANLGKDYAQGIQDYWYAAERIGNDQVIRDTKFSPRTIEQMGTSDFKLPATYFQMLGRSSMPVWNEPEIEYKGQTYLPHPGKDNWNSGRMLYSQNLLYDATSGNDRDRRDPYLSPTLGDWERVPFSGHYHVAK